MLVQKITFYMDVNTWTKRYDQNVDMTGTKNKKTRERHMVLLINVEAHTYNPKDSKYLSLQRIICVSRVACLTQK
jgi:hypothetical protein